MEVTADYPWHVGFTTLVQPNINPFDDQPDREPYGFRVTWKNQVKHTNWVSLTCGSDERRFVSFELPTPPVEAPPEKPPRLLPPTGAPTLLPVTGGTLETTHVVVNGDSLWSIWELLGRPGEWTSFRDTVAAENGLTDPGLIRIGQILVIPAT